MPDNDEDRRWIIECEINHCRLGMVAAIGMIAQEYFTGIPVVRTAADLLSGMSTTSITV